VSSLVYELEVDVVRDRSHRPWIERTHYVTVAVDDRDNLTSADNEARNVAAWMCWHIRGEMVTGARIVSCEL
jgi:hypothetical protein